VSESVDGLGNKKKDERKSFSLSYEDEGMVADSFCTHFPQNSTLFGEMRAKIVFPIQKTKES
jgi:hypothetical protein